MSDIEVASLNCYPIKACAPMELDEAVLDEFGIEYDREWVLVGPKGQVLTQRICPELALVQTRIEDGRLVATAPHMAELAISLERDTDAEKVPVTLWKKPGVGTNEGAKASAYFSEFLGRSARLLRVWEPRHIRLDTCVAGASERIAFADGYQLLLASLGSLAELKGHLQSPIGMDRFRANIVVKGAEAYDEDYWREICIGDLRAFVVRACARCPVPNVDQSVGVLPQERAVTQALRATRHGIDLVGGETGDFFGQNLAHVFEPGATVRVGDKLTVVARADKRNWAVIA